MFEAFLAAFPAFAAGVETFRQPAEEFPDVVVRLKDGTEVEVELGEWVAGPQMAAAIRYDRLRDAIIDAIGQGPNLSRHFDAVMLCPRSDAPDFDPADAAAFKAALDKLIRETEQQWASAPGWHSPQGRICRELQAYAPLGKYLESVNFVVRGAMEPWRPGQPWIDVEARGGSYSPEHQLEALRRILEKKIAHYGATSRRVWLIIYYAQAAAYNPPYVGIGTRKFEDVARRAATFVRGQLPPGQLPFEKIYLLSALEPRPEVFEIYPGVVRCG